MILPIAASSEPSATFTRFDLNGTKPLHRSQMVIEEDMEGYTTFQLEVIVNPELERDLLAYGCGITVLSPQSLVKSIRRHHKASVNP